MSGNLVSVKDIYALNKLIGMALLDDEIQRQLLHDRNSHLLDSFALSKRTQAWLQTIEATTLAEFAGAIQDHLPGSPRDLPS